jgi:hypothetical protein
MYHWAFTIRVFCTCFRRRGLRGPRGERGETGERGEGGVRGEGELEEIQGSKENKEGEAGEEGEGRGENKEEEFFFCLPSSLLLRGSRRTEFHPQEVHLID